MTNYASSVKRLAMKVIDGHGATRVASPWQPQFLERLVDEGLDSPSAPGVPTPERLACMMENGNLASMA